MDKVRYVMAVLLVISIPPAVIWWFIVHPFVGFWRRVGTRWTFTFLGVFYFASIFGLFFVREALVGTDYGTSWWLVLAAVPFLVVGGVVAKHRKKHLNMKTLAGVPEIAPDAEGPGLLREGIYARIRHPRYVEFTLGGIGWSLLINYLGVYLMVAGTLVALVAIVVLEERELRDRFGEAYAEYCAEVPRFIPRRGAGSS